MSSTYSNSLRIELIGTGDQAGTWGATTDSNLAYVLDTAIAGYQTVSVTAASQALTYLSGATPTAGLNQSVYAMLRFTTTTGAAFSVYAPPVSKQYIVYNNSGYSMTIYNSTVIGNTTAAGTGVTVTNGAKIMVWSDGTNFYELQAANLTGTLAIANGGTGQVTANAAFNALAPAQTANRLLKSDGTNTSFAQAVLTTDVTGTLPVANGGTGVTTSTGSGNNVLSTSPTLVTPILGTPQSGTLSSCTGLPLTTGVTGTLPVANGGTGQTTQQAAINALAGTQINNRVLRSDGTNTTLSQVVLTSDVSGTLPVANGGTGVTTAAAITSLVGNLLFPVGAIYSSTSSTNPGTSLGFGTWTQFGAGRMMMGAGGAFAAGTTGGSNDATLVSHTHTASSTFTGSALPTHAHALPYLSNFSGGGQGIASVGTQITSGSTTSVSAGTPSGTVSTTVDAAGSSGTNANLPPYIVVYMWQRTA